MLYHINLSKTVVKHQSSLNTMMLSCYELYLKSPSQ